MTIRDPEDRKVAEYSAKVAEQRANAGPELSPEEDLIDAAIRWIRSRGGPDDQRELAFSDLEYAATTLAVIDEERRWGDDT